MAHLLYLLITYRYWILFPLAIGEGPIVAVIAGFLCTKGLLSPFIVYPVIVSGDIVGDSLVYWLGRVGRSSRPSRFWLFRRASRTCSGNKEKLERLRVYFDTNPVKTVSLSKIALGFGVAGIFLAGNSKVPYYKFLLICLLTSAGQYIIYLGAGLLFGHAYIKIARYLNSLAAITIVAFLAILAFFFIKSLHKQV